MKYVLLMLGIFSITRIEAQSPVPDSTLNEFTRLTCECATLMKVDQQQPSEGFENLMTCVKTNLSLYIQNGWLKEKDLLDSVYYYRFINALQEKLYSDCPAAKRLFDKANREAAEPSATVPPAYFISEAFLKAKNLEKNTINNSQMQRWSAKDMGTAAIQMVFDIRLIFENEKDASEYLEIKEQELSEGGSTTDHNLQAFGTDASQVYGENKNLTAAFGDLDMAQFNFVFRIKNVVAKVFVSGSKKMAYADAEAFAKEAIARIKAVAGH